MMAKWLLFIPCITSSSIYWWKRRYRRHGCSVFRLQVFIWRTNLCLPWIRKWLVFYLMLWVSLVLFVLLEISLSMDPLFTLRKLHWIFGILTPRMKISWLIHCCLLILVFLVQLTRTVLERVLPVNMLIQLFQVIQNCEADVRNYVIIHLDYFWGFFQIITRFISDTVGCIYLLRFALILYQFVLYIMIVQHLSLRHL